MTGRGVTLLRGQIRSARLSLTLLSALSAATLVACTDSPAPVPSASAGLASALH